MLEYQDPEIHYLINDEFVRQDGGIELIASENYTSAAVMEAQGSILTNKYAEGYPGKRYYGGCEVIDQIESLAINRLTQLFGAKYANVQPHSGSSANLAAYLTLIQPGDLILGMNLAQGGHLTHGSSVNFSGKLFKTEFYGLNPQTERLDYDEIRKIAKATAPRLIIAGASSYSRTIDFSAFHSIANEVNAHLIVDMAHIAGLVAANLHPTPVGLADIVTSTTHKTLRGPRGGVILTDKEDLAKKINSSIFPGIQGGPLEHVIAAKAVCFGEALKPEFCHYQKQVLENCQAMAEVFLDLDIELVSGGSDNHLLLIKTNNLGISGKEAEALLSKAHITCNKNMIPGDSRSPFVTSGIRLGTPAITTRGFNSSDCTELAANIAEILKSNRVSDQNIHWVKSICEKYPLS